MKSLILVEDDERLAELVSQYLTANGFSVIRFADGEGLIERVKVTPPDAIILDVMLPGDDGFTLCNRLRQFYSGPLLFMTAKSESFDQVLGLEIGADDYVVKPFSMTELKARIRAVMRRIRPGLAEDKVVVGDIEVDRTAHRVNRNGREIHLGPTEFRLLDYLIQYPGRVFSREQLLNAVWGSDVYVEARTVDVHIGRLRKAINEPGEKDPVRTVRSAGYALKVEDD